MTTTYKFDVADRLVEADQGGSTIFTATYDAATQRLSMIGNGQTTLFRYDGGQNFQEVQGGSVVTELIRAGGLGGGIGSVLYSDKSMDATPGPVETFRDQKRCQPLCQPPCSELVAEAIGGRLR